MPLALPGTRVITQIAADRVGWYIEPTPEQYCCNHIHFPDMMVECNVFFCESPIFSCFSYWLSNANSTRFAPSAKVSNIHTVRHIVIWPSNNEFLHASSYHPWSCLSTKLFQQTAPSHTSAGADPWNTSRYDPSPALYSTSSKGDHSPIPCTTVLQPATITHAQLCSALLEGCWQVLQSIYRPSWNNQQSSSWCWQGNMLRIAH